MNIHATPIGAILVGVDVGDHSDRAVDWAADQAALERRPLLLVHATGPTMWGKITTEDVEVLARAADRATHRQPGLALHTEVIAEDARPALLRHAATAEMVVVGSRGRGPARSRLLGSVSASVAHQASCPVVVVRPHHPGAVRRGVYVGVDGTAGSAPVVEFAYRHAAIRGLPLTAMHCVWDYAAPTTRPRSIPRTQPGYDDARLLLAESTSGMTEKYPDVHVTPQLWSGLPQDCLAQAAEHADIIVVGRRQIDPFTRALFGEVSGRVVEHADCVVAVVPDDPNPNSSRHIDPTARDLRP
jgi:nucleotide-binding universal stress UspA family protein